MSEQTLSQPILIPVPGKVYVRRLEAAPSNSTYVIPDSAREKSTRAVVVAVPNRPCYEYGILVPCPVDPGDEVLLGKYSGDYEMGNQKVTIVRWDELLAVIVDPVADESKGTL